MVSFDSEIPPEIRKRVLGEEKPKARKFWRWLLRVIIILQLLVADFIVIGVGYGWIQLDHTVVIAFFTKIVAEIIGLVFLAVRYDFSD